ncbi:MAG: sensor histidine kinase, partial [Prochlorothrix sp.]
FIYGNLKPAQEYVQDLLTIIHAYQEAYPHPTDSLQELLEDLEIEFIEEDIFKLMQSMRVGAERIRDLVLSLRNFSRLDEAAMKPARMEEGLDSTLLILRHQLSEQDQYPAVEVIKEYDTTPETLCYPSQLNQVFMNILSNAIDAMRGYDNPITTPQIHIKTLRHGDDKIRIKIADNGCGISDEIKPQIFDPFFTTKPVGSGQGLGLSICYQIVVDKHQGRLWCRSKVGQGSEFTIEIPYCSPERETLAS